MRNFKLEGVARKLQLGKNGPIIDSDGINPDVIKILNESGNKIRLKGANPVDGDDYVTLSHLLSLLQNETGSFIVPLNQAGQVEQFDQPIVDIQNYDKFEIEYSMWLPILEKLQVGRLTVLYDGIAAQITSHEIEHSTNLGEILTVQLAPYMSGNDLGVSVLNESDETFEFKYKVVNKFRIGAVVTLPASPYSLALKNPDAVLSEENYNAVFSGTSTYGYKSAYADRQLEVAQGGKFYFEVEQSLIGNNSNSVAVGFLNIDTVPDDFTPSQTGTYFQEDDDYVSIYAILTGSGYVNEVTHAQGSVLIGPYDTAFQLGDNIGVALDLDAKKFWHQINGVWQTGNPETGQGGIDVSANLIGSLVYFGISHNATATQAGARIIKNPLHLPLGFEKV